MDRADLLLGILAMAREKWSANLLFLISDREDLVELVLRKSAIPIVLGTSDADLAQGAKGRVRSVLRLTEPLTGSIGVLPQAKDALLAAFLEGILKPGDRVVVLVSNVDAFDVVLFADVDRDVELTHLRRELEGAANMVVIERLLRIASELAREGREGKPVGTLFVVGDPEAVLERSRQGVLNPFMGHPEKERNLLDEETVETIKEFALIDGAFVVRGDGTILAAGRYIDVDKRVPLQAGLGGRHLAAASITRTTKAVAIAVSSNGSIRVFKDGRVIMMLGKI